ncbi:hypothetical protein Q427_08815 [Halomonas sp. BC04]|nr:hypothetical protein Q427_08815 [Halomonas sp. BC04]
MLNRLHDRVKVFGKSRFARNVATVATGIAAAQAISLAFMPFLTRLYGPEAFGELAAFTAVVNIITPLATLGYANAIVMPEAEEGAAAVARLSLVCASVVAPVVLIFVYLFQARLATWTGLKTAPDLLYLIPVSLLVMALLSVANQTAIREGLFKAKAGSHVASTLVMNLGKLAGGLLAPTGLQLIVLSVVGNALNFLLLLAHVPRKGVFEVRRWFGTAGIRSAALLQRDFALYRMPQSIINAMSLGLPVIVLTALFGATTAGQYSITMLVLSAPVMLLGKSVGEVFYPKITRAIHDKPENAADLIRKSIVVLALVSVVPFGAIALFGTLIFPFIFGAEWGRAGEFSQWIALWLTLKLMSRPALAAMPALLMQRHLLIYEVLVTIARIGSLYIGAAYIEDDVVSIAMFSCVNAAGYALLMLIVWRKVQQLVIRST